VPEMRPFTTFNFLVEIAFGGNSQLCKAAFAECSGLEATVEVKTIREGGNNSQPIHLTGPVSYSQLTLRRGMTRNFDLWDWFDRVLRDGEQHLRATCDVRIRSSYQPRPADAVVFRLSGCIPTKIKAPALNAKDGVLAIEELQIAYQLLERRPTGGGPVA
jgi:phage tail-like protein